MVERVNKYQTHSVTSRAAAHQIEMDAATLRAQVYKTIIKSGRTGMTDEEVQDTLSMNPSTQRPRRVELCERGLVFDSTHRRLTHSRRSAVVWQAMRAPEQQQELFNG